MPEQNPEPVDPDLAATLPPTFAQLVGRHGDVLAVIAAGGLVGSLGRFALAQLWPHTTGGFAWSTLLVNVLGAFALGVLSVLVARRWPRLRYVRPFWGVGVLGGFTTFSTLMLDLREIGGEGSAGVLLAYLLATLVAGIGAAWAGLALTRRILPHEERR